MAGWAETGELWSMYLSTSVPKNWNYRTFLVDMRLFHLVLRGVSTPSLNLDPKH